MIDLKKLRKSANAVNQEEPWVSANDLTDLAWTADRKFIEECSPKIVLELLDMLEAAQEDAARYRWLRDKTEWEPFDSAWLIQKDIYGCPTLAMDVAIDAAMRS